jgi:hypothetical protein
MTPQQLIILQVVVAVLGAAAGMIAAGAAFVAALSSARNRGAIQLVRLEINGRLTELLRTSGEKALLDGHALGLAEGRTIAAAETRMVALALATDQAEARQVAADRPR